MAMGSQTEEIQPPSRGKQTRYVLVGATVRSGCPKRRGTIGTGSRVFGELPDSTFFNEFAKELPFDLVDEKTITENASYKAFETSSGETSDDKNPDWMQRYLCADGYKPMFEPLFNKNKNAVKMLEIFKEVDGVMFVFLDYAFIKKVAIGGMGSAGMKAFAHVKLWNRKGDKVFAINEYATSDKTVAVVSGLPLVKTEKILPMCEDASNQLFEDLKKRIPKMTKKADKNL
jgi:RNase H-fold protein (predicted Holliday junction resolvase)